VDGGVFYTLTFYSKFFCGINGLILEFNNDFFLVHFNMSFKAGHTTSLFIHKKKFLAIWYLTIKSFQNVILVFGHLMYSGALLVFFTGCSAGCCGGGQGHFSKERHLLLEFQGHQSKE
jgi:hypothetical protein